ncbi:hypothetical protein FHU30_007019 [Actinomadura rupiterrae]|nr:hypothetical protein [Actinomadura rupiterrae]
MVLIAHRVRLPEVLRHIQAGRIVVVVPADHETD